MTFTASAVTEVAECLLWNDITYRVFFRICNGGSFRFKELAVGDPK